MILAGDVGGTKTSLALFDRRGRATGPPVEAESLAGARFPHFQALLDDYLGRHPARLTGACFGVAGPVVRGSVHITHLGWDIEGAAVARQLGIERAHLINDLVANAYGIAALSPDELDLIHPGEPADEANVGLVSPGTGLGESILARVNGNLVPIPSEAGHADYAPRTDEDLRVFQALRARHGRVSWERILSGPGIAALGQFFHEERGLEKEWRAHQESVEAAGVAEVVTRLGMDGSCPACGEALNLFVSALGAESGNVALRAMARGGIYIGGGIAPKILPALKTGRFVEAFRDKEHLRPLLSAIPVWVIRNERTALLGAARYASLVETGP